MRIAFLLGEFPTVSQTFILNQITGLLAQNHEVHVYALQRGDEQLLLDQPEQAALRSCLHYCPPMPDQLLLRALKAAALFLRDGWRQPLALLRTLNFWRFGKLASGFWLFYLAIALTNQGPYDIIHGQYGPYGLMGLILRELGLVQGKLVTSFRGYDLARLTARAHQPAYQRLFAKGDFFLPVAETLKAQLLQAGCPAHKLKVHYSGIVLNQFAHQRRHSPPNHCIQLVSVGRLVEKKGITYAIQAVAALHQRNYCIAYQIVGAGPLKEQLETQVNDLGLRDTVTFWGALTPPGVVALLNRAHIFVAPSLTAAQGDQEGIPNVLKEAMATGLPVVSTTHSGIPELVQHGVTGLLVPERDADALAQALADLIDHPARWSEMGRRGRDYVAQHFNRDALTQELVAIYQALLVG